MKRQLLVLLLLAVTPAIPHAQSFISKEEALRLCFPEPMTIERRTAFLTDEEARAIEDRAHSKVPSRLLTYYVGRDSATIRGYAFIETDIVRTMPQTLLIHIAPDARVRSVELLAFHEPADYRAPQPWLDLFRNRRLDEELWLKRGLHNIAGATITGQTTISLVRRMLATCEIVVAGKN